MTLRVLIVSDVRVVQEGLRSILVQRDGVDVVYTVDMLHARDETVRLRPDIVLFDAARDGSIGMMRDVVVATPHSKVVAFGVKETDEEVLALAAAGTAGYVSDSAGGADVLKALEQVMCDELPCSPKAAASLFRCVAALFPRVNGIADDVGYNSGRMLLSPRELQISGLIERGLTNKEIGRQLGIEAATVKNHIHNIFGKLNVHRRGEAITRIRAILHARVHLPARAPEVTSALERGELSK
jgi:DNA-binding NarL/FixJ family response regulator